MLGKERQTSMPTLALTNFNIIVSLLGAWISLFGLVSFLLKETFYLSEAREFPEARKTQQNDIILPVFLYCWENN